MGCAPSTPQDVDILPIKPHCRTAFARCSTTDRACAGGHEKHFGQQQDAEGHDVVLCYPLGGTVYGLELQGRYEKMDSLSLWTLEQFLSVPSTPMHAMKSMSGGTFSSSGMAPVLGPEIKPVPEEAGDAEPPSAQQLSREIRLCRRGVVVLVTAGCTWDEGVLTCLRLAGRFLRPLVLVHCVQSCPLPALEEWPPDVRPLIAAAGPPVKYLAQHSAEALQSVEQRMLAAAAAAAAAAAGQQGDGGGGGVGQQGAGPPAAAEPVAAPQPGQPQVVVSLQPPAGQGTTRTKQSPAAQMRTQPQQSQQQQPPPQQQQQQQQQQAHPGEAGPPGPGPLSLAALQASDSGICRRAAQLLGAWGSRDSSRPASGAELSPGLSTSRSNSPITTTLVEPIVSSPTRGLSNNILAGAPRSPGGSAARQSPARSHPGCRAPGTGVASDASTRAGTLGQQQQQQHPQPQGAQQQQRLPTESGLPHSHSGPQGQRRELQQGQRRTASGLDASSSGNRGPGAGGRPPRCLLRYRDRRWATVCAFVCAQLELELGRSSVGLQVAASSGAAAIVAAPSGRESAGQRGPWGPGASGGGGGASGSDSWVRRQDTQLQQQQQQLLLARASHPQQPKRPSPGASVDLPQGSPHTHHHHHHHHHHHRQDQQQQQQQRRQESSSVPRDVATAAAGTFLPSGQSSISRGSSGRCSTASSTCCGGASGGCGGSTGPEVPSSNSNSIGSDSHRRRGSAAANELVTLNGSTSSSDGGAGAAACGADGGSCRGGAAARREQHAAAAVTAASSSISGVRGDLRTRSWAAAELEPAAAAAAAAVAAGDWGGPDATLVYFVSPGLSAPLACLEEVGGALSCGRRLQLVVDGECCQRLPDWAPAGVTPEGWKALKKLWQHRLLYVPDYHTAFCGLLRQGVAAAAEAAGGAAGGAQR